VIAALGLFLVGSIWALRGLPDATFWTGLEVHLQPPSAPQHDLGIAPLRIYIDAHHKVYVDSQPVGWEDLASVLRKGMALRPPGWPVYVDADRDLEVQWPMRAIDIVRGIQMEVVLVSR
jgi:biopolymer transport protein ExbD